MQTNRKENEHFENLLLQPCDLVFRTAVLRCCSQHCEASARNPENCPRRQVHGCRKADVKQALFKKSSHQLLAKGYAGKLPPVACPGTVWFG